jgi:hypothetical protein
VVVALAIALVLIRDIPNGSAVPPAPSTSATGPGGIPRYYAAIGPVTGKRSGPNTLVVGDSLTGKTMATIPSPNHMLFQGVTAAADDRTFVAYALTLTQSGGSSETGSWFEVRLAPGTAAPARLTPLPIKPVSAPLKYGVFAMALSGSALELAVAEVPSAKGGMAVKVFSLATGRLLHDWTTNGPSLSVPINWSYGFTSPSALSWIDGDHALALTTMGKAPARDNGTETMRRLNVDGQPNGDLLTDSKVIWTTPPAGRTSAETHGLTCGDLLVDVLPVISADGKTVSCPTLSQQGTSPSLRWTVTFSTYRLAAGPTAADQGTVAYQVTRPVPGATGGTGAAGGATLLWVSPSGGTLIGVWQINGSGLDSEGPVHVGLISHGKFTPLQSLAGFTWADLNGIAW